MGIQTGYMGIQTGYTGIQAGYMGIQAGYMGIQAGYMEIGLTCSAEWNCGESCPKQPQIGSVPCEWESVSVCVCVCVYTRVCVCRAACHSVDSHINDLGGVAVYYNVCTRYTLHGTMCNKQWLLYTHCSHSCDQWSHWPSGQYT